MLNILKSNLRLCWLAGQNLITLQIVPKLDKYQNIKIAMYNLQFDDDCKLLLSWVKLAECWILF